MRPIFSQYGSNPGGGGGGVPRISSDGDDQRIFWGFEILDPGIFWVAKFGDMSRFELCYENYENCENLQRFNENYENREYLQISQRAPTRMTKITKTANICKYRRGPQRELRKLREFTRKA